MPPVSPRTQALMQPPPTEEDARLAFEDGFSQMAQRVVTSRFPDLVGSIVTFKVLSADMDTSSAVGTFVLDYNGVTVHIPVILASNKIKPLEVMYIPDKDVFLPLQRPWLDEVSQSMLNNLGEGIQPPKTLATDIDIRNLVVPPSSGRVAYASAETGAHLARFLDQAPNHIKRAFVRILEERRPVLKFAYEKLNLEGWKSVLAPRREKKAAAIPNAHVLTVEDSAERFRQVFGGEAGRAFQKAAAQGYVVRDDRPFAKLAVENESPLWLHEATDSGFYRLHLTDGTTTDALVIANPRPLQPEMRHAKTMGATPLPDPYTEHNKPVEGDKVYGKDYIAGESARFLVLTADGSVSLCVDPPVGEKIPESDVSPALLKKISGEDSFGDNYGLFVRYEAGKASATVPFKVGNVTTDSSGVRRVTTGWTHDRVLVTDPKSAIHQIVSPEGSNVTYIPDSYKFISASNADSRRFMSRPDAVLRSNEALSKVGSLQTQVVDAGGGMFSVHGQSPVSKLGAVKLLVHGFHLRESDTARILDTVEKTGSHKFYVVNPASLVKIAQLVGEPVPGMPAGAPPQGMPPGDPAAMAPQGMPPEMFMAPPAPPPPDPVQLAVTEIGSQLAEQASDVAQQLAEQQRDLSNQLNVLNAVQQRAQEIASESTGMPPEGPPTGAPPEAAGPPVGASVPGPGMPGPGMPGPGMPGPGMPGPGMPGPGMPGPGMPGPGMPGPGMPVEQPMSEEMLAQQAGPMMEQAAMLQDPEAFEATAIASMASNPDMRGNIAEYIPVLEQAVDNLSRILISLWMEEDKYRTELGEDDYSNLEDKLRTVLENLGGLVLTLNHTAMAVKPDDEVIA